MTSLSPEEGFEEFRATLRPVQVRAPLVETEEHVEIRKAAEALAGLPALDVVEIATALAAPRGLSRTMLRVLGLAVGLSHERLTSELRAHLSDEARRRPLDVVQFLDSEFGLVREIAAARARRYSWGDVLVARAGSRRTAGQAAARLRRVGRVRPAQ